MFPILADYLEVLGSDERFLVFALSSIILATVLLFFVRNACRVTRLLLFCAAFLIVFAYVVLAPLTSLSLVEQSAEISPVSLNLNFGFLALGLGLFLKFRNLPVGKAKNQNPQN